MKVKIAEQNVVIIKTSITVAQVKVLQDLDPSALALKDSNGQETFRVSIVDGEPALGKYGVELNPKRDIVLQFDRPVTEESLKASHGTMFTKLARLEAQIKEAFEANDISPDQISFETLE